MLDILKEEKLFNEVMQDIKLKSQHLINNQIIPIICIGETYEEKISGKTFERDVLRKQITNSLPENSI